MAALYKNKSVAEQNSLDIAWAVLMSEEFEELRETLLLEPISSDSVKHCQYVLATDILTRSRMIRKNRWDRALVTTKSITISGLIVNEHHAGFRRVAHDAALDVYRKWNYHSLRCARPKTRSHGRGPFDLLQR
jgi:hypothetical protein